MRSIDADAFIDFIKDVIRKNGYRQLELNEHLTVADVLDAVIGDLDGTGPDGFDNAPTIDAEPVRYGHWVYDPNGMDRGLPAWICSECHCQNNNIPTHIRGKDSMIRVTEPLRWAGSDYCPNCGARMVREE